MCILVGMWRCLVYVGVNPGSCACIYNPVLNIPLLYSDNKRGNTAGVYDKGVQFYEIGKKKKKKKRSTKWLPADRVKTLRLT